MTSNPTSPVSPADPLRTLWEHLGCPNPDTPRDREGTCARCNTHDAQASRIKTVVSDKFTGWDAYTNIKDPLWCTPCAWAHTTVALRVRPWLITTDCSTGSTGSTGSTEPTRTQLTTLLTEALPHTTALTVPIARQKHILPAARWGHLATDDRVLRWDDYEATRFQVVCALRTLGFSEAALHEPTPRFEQLITLAPDDMRHTLTLWDLLAPWRADDTYLSLACIASRPSKERAA